ncbi:holdfast anchor protein HfaD, partial [Brevundimonas sp.]|uniref:holdfast anchor protein HfaD n=1 Tax=Brevundimonas sp. TaxID=1871086 RepID=UPI002FD95B42
WDLAGRANAAANQAVFANQGGALITATDQANAGRVRAATVVTAYDFGSATAQARGVGNEVSAGNNDIYLEIDNLQLNNGQIDASAAFSGGTGYDAYVGADAVGNSVTGYACSQCEGYIDARNTQTNTANITATTTVTTQGSSRAVIAGANAVGNAATFYVSRPAD